MNAGAIPDPVDISLRDADCPSEYPSDRTYPGDGVNGMFQLVGAGLLCWLLRLLRFKEKNMGHYRKLGEFWNHKTMRSNFLIAGSCLRVLYQSSLQGQSSQPAELLGFGSCDVGSLLPCAREHTPGALL